MSNPEYRLETLITGMCAGKREDELKDVILAAIPDQHKWCLSYDHGSRLTVTDGDEKVFGDRDSGRIDVLDQIRLAVLHQDSGNIGRADEVVAENPQGLIFYNLLLILYAKWRDLHGSGADDTDSTSDSVYSPGDFDMGVSHRDFDLHAKLNALKMSMHK
jgi:hypothetical protein